VGPRDARADAGSYSRHRPDRERCRLPAVHLGRLPAALSRYRAGQGVSRVTPPVALNQSMSLCQAKRQRRPGTRPGSLHLDVHQFLLDSWRKISIALTKAQLSLLRKDCCGRMVAHPEVANSEVIFVPTSQVRFVIQSLPKKLRGAATWCCRASGPYLATIGQRRVHSCLL